MSKADMSKAEAGFLRHEFAIPRDASQAYLCGHSLGLMPAGATTELERVVNVWRTLGVDGHFSGDDPWVTYDEPIAAMMADLVGATAFEVAIMGTLTTNIHHLLASFYVPRGRRTKILIEHDAFPSDRYAVESQLRWHGLDPATHLLEVQAVDGGHYPTECFREVLASHGDEVALVWLGGVCYLTGELLDIPAITRLGHEAGCIVGFDLAHAAGNVVLDLHTWGVDFATWCTYKYLNSGPGAVAAIFVHERHADDPSRLRLGGWWGVDRAARFAMNREFRPVAGAAGWRASNPPILALAPMRASLELFHRVGISELRAAATKLTSWTIGQLSTLTGLSILTPSDPKRRGGQLSVRVNAPAHDVQRSLHEAGVVVDVRPPDVLRFAFAPLYNTERDAQAVVDALANVLAASRRVP